MWEFILPSLLKAIESEPEKDIQAEVMSSLAQVIHIIIVAYRFYFSDHDWLQLACPMPIIWNCLLFIFVGVLMFIVSHTFIYYFGLIQVLQIMLF